MKTELYQRLQSVMSANDQRVRHCARAVYQEISALGLPIRSVLDLGCGAGSWLKVAQDAYGARIAGLDGEWTDTSVLHIDRDAFQFADLTRSIDLKQNFDVAVTVEVAEHLEPAAADTFVESLCNHADVVIFSAAIPSQGGVGHVNEQWPEYWSEKFAGQGLACYDILRHKIWEDVGIDWWYKQNLLLFARPEAMPNGVASTATPARLVHPDLFEVRCRHVDGDIIYENGASDGTWWAFDKETAKEIAL